MTNAASRATASSRASRAGSTVRDIAKRRDKPFKFEKAYKTEKQNVVTKRNKLALETTYNKTAAGFTFLPVGTSDLAQRCKELSRQRNYPVHVVNAKPISKRAEDPERVSFHIHRIGYHFKSEVLEEACTELGYIYHRDRFVKETDLLQQHRDNALAQTLAKYGLRHNPLKDAQGANARESPEVVAAAIKELFPRIQDADLDMIVKHAWAEGSDRVGTNAELGLPRRVQLAVIARIRHTYTDYDTLLRVFDWADARILVEPDCLKKLIEWRGETEDDDDNVFEEIVRETIVIDDEEEEDGVRRRGSEADDEDSARELEPGGASETELEITHHEVTDIDVGAESVDERTRRYIGVPPVRRSQKLQERSNIARQKIGAARQRLRNGEPPKAYAMVPAPQLPVGPANGEGRTNGAAHTQQSGYDQYGERVWKDGQWFRKIPLQAPLPQQSVQQGIHSLQQSGTYWPRPQLNGVQASPHTPTPSLGRAQAPQDRPVQSIERQDCQPNAHTPAASSNYGRPVTPDGLHAEKRRRIDGDRTLQDSYGDMAHAGTRSLAFDDRPSHLQAPSGDVINLISPEQPRRGEVIDLTSPARPVYRYEQNAPSTYRQPRPDPYNVAAVQYAASRLYEPAQQAPSQPTYPEVQYQVRPVDPAEYDPTRPLMQPYEQHGTSDFRQPQQPVQQLYTLPPPPNGEPYPRPAPYEQQQYVRYEQPPPQAQQTRYFQQPIHGAPAPVQQVPREQYQYANSARQPAVMRGPPPMDGAPAPTQYFYREGVQATEPLVNGAPAPTQFYQPR